MENNGILKGKSFEQLRKEHEEHTGRAKIIADTAASNFYRPAYYGTSAEVRSPYHGKACRQIVEERGDDLK